MFSVIAVGVPTTQDSVLWSDKSKIIMLINTICLFDTKGICIRKKAPETHCIICGTCPGTFYSGYQALFSFNADLLLYKICTWKWSRIYVHGYGSLPSATALL